MYNMYVCGYIRTGTD